MTLYCIVIQYQVFFINIYEIVNSVKLFTKFINSFQ